MDQNGPNEKRSLCFSARWRVLVGWDALETRCLTFPLTAQAVRQLASAGATDPTVARLRRVCNTSAPTSQKPTVEKLAIQRGPGVISSVTGQVWGYWAISNPQCVQRTGYAECAIRIANGDSQAHNVCVKEPRIEVVGLSSDRSISARFVSQNGSSSAKVARLTQSTETFCGRVDAHSGISCKIRARVPSSTKRVTLAFDLAEESDHPLVRAGPAATKFEFRNLPLPTEPAHSALVPN